MKTLDSTIMEARHKSPINNTIKGVQAHIDKIKLAQNRKMEAV